MYHRRFLALPSVFRTLFMAVTSCFPIFICLYCSNDETLQSLIGKSGRFYKSVILTTLYIWGYILEGCPVTFPGEVKICLKFSSCLSIGCRNRIQQRHRSSKAATYFLWHWPIHCLPFTN